MSNMRSLVLIVKNGSIAHEIPITYNFYKNDLKQSLLMENFYLYYKIHPKYLRNFTDDEGNVVAEDYDTDYNRWSEIPVEKVLEGYYDVEEYEGIIFNNRFTKFYYSIFRPTNGVASYSLMVIAIINYVTMKP